MHQPLTVGDDRHAFGDKIVDDAVDRLLVSRNRARGEDHEIAGRKHKLSVVVLGSTRQCSPRLALAAGHDRHDLVARQFVERVRIEERLEEEREEMEEQLEEMEEQMAEAAEKSAGAADDTAMSSS